MVASNDKPLRRLQLWSLNGEHNSVATWRCCHGRLSAVREKSVGCHWRLSGTRAAHEPLSGKGIKEGEEEKIFEHFYKVDAYKEGVGLGLPLARRVARQLGGDVVLDTSYKEGSRFILKLPVA